MIRASRLFVIDHEGTPRGEMTLQEAMKLAEAAEMDLVEVSPNANPPVAKILDLGKYKYDLTKAQQRQKKHHKEVIVKEVRLGPMIGDHDLQVKVKQAEKFLGLGHKVKASVMFRGRQMAHMELGHEVLEKLVDRLRDKAKMEQAPIRQGRSIHIIIAPTK
ncbi:MAG: translation initiation factor IF-3 [Patescibacteria group bacterium]|jgi:translation initiation factor IF-3